MNEFFCSLDALGTCFCFDIADEVHKLEELDEKYIIVVPDPVDPPTQNQVPEVLEIPDEEVPLAEAPLTGDASALFGGMSAFSAFGMAMLRFFGRKKRDEE